MKFNNTEVFNLDGSIRGMRNPLESWNKSDSAYCVLNDTIDCNICNFHNKSCNMLINKYGSYILGQNDMYLAQKLIKAGESHSKFLRQIMVSVDITAPLYWWKEYSTYKVGSVENSTSTMHKLSTTSITKECFEFDSIIEQFGDTEMSVQEAIINLLENYRQEYLRSKDVRVWKALIQLLPSAWLQTRTCTLNYAVLRNMYFSRRNHKLSEWSADFINWIGSLPYSKELICYE